MCFTSHNLEVVKFGSGEFGSGEFGSGDLGSGDLGSGDFDQFGISQVLRLTSTKIPGGIWSKYLVKIVISQVLRLKTSQAGLIRPIFISQGLRLKTSQAGLIGKRSKELIKLYLTGVEIKNKPGGLNWTNLYLTEVEIKSKPGGLDWNKVYK